jgi:hypothetical protein
MSQYKNLRLNPPKLTVKENAKEVIFKTISAMCDNVGYLRFKKNNDGEFKQPLPCAPPNSPVDYLIYLSTLILFHHTYDRTTFFYKGN